MVLNKGIVAAVHPTDHTVDVVLADGRRLTGVQVATPNGSTRTGTFDMPDVPPKGDKWDITKITGQDQIALVAWAEGIPIVVGFLYPQICQMTWDDPKKRVSRHQSDVYSTTSGQGDTEWRHPSGTYVRVAQAPSSEVLEQKDFDQKFKIDRNTDKAVHLHITLANEANGEVFTLNVDPEGEVRIWAKKEIKIESEMGIRMFAPRIDLNLPGDSGVGKSPA